MIHFSNEQIFVAYCSFSRYLLLIRLKTIEKKEKYRKTAERKEIDHEAFLDAKLLRDFKETKKYLGTGLNTPDIFSYWCSAYYIGIGSPHQFEKPLYRYRAKFVES